MELSIGSAAVQKGKAKALDDTELMNLVDNKAKVVLYSDLYKYGSISELLAPHGAVFLLYQQTPNYGHWCAVFRQDKYTIEFFDPYSGLPDSELHWTSPEMRKKLNMNYPYLTDLLYNAPPHIDITYNQHKFQKMGKNISTCGRWVACRVAMRHLPLTEFVKLFDKKAKHNDEIVTIMTTFNLK